MRKILIGLAMLALVGCEAKSKPNLTPEQVETAKKEWTGTWRGAWGGGNDCGSSVNVSEVDGSTARGKYSWDGGCGAAAGSMVDSSAQIEGKKLKVDLTWGTTVVYTMRDDGNLDGFWQSKRQGASAKAVFYKQ